MLGIKEMKEMRTMNEDWGNMTNSKMSIMVILVQEEQSNSPKSLKCLNRGSRWASSKQWKKSTNFRLLTSLFFPCCGRLSRWTRPVLVCVLSLWLTHQWSSPQLFKFHSCLFTGTKCHLRKCLCNKYIGRD